MFVVVHDVSGSGQLESGAAASLCLHHPFHRHGLSDSRFFSSFIFFSLLLPWGPQKQMNCRPLFGQGSASTVYAS